MVGVEADVQPYPEQPDNARCRQRVQKEMDVEARNGTTIKEPAPGMAALSLESEAAR